MTVPKSKGFRAIVVGNYRYMWRFSGHILVVPAGLSGRQVLEIDFGWFDGWLYASNAADRPPEFSPKVVTPSFVALAIDFALRNGWSTDLRGGRFVVNCRGANGFNVGSRQVLNAPPSERT